MPAVAIVAAGVGAARPACAQAPPPAADVRLVTLCSGDGSERDRAAWRAALTPAGPPLEAVVLDEFTRLALRARLARDPAGVFALLRAAPIRAQRALVLEVARQEAGPESFFGRQFPFAQVTATCTLYDLTPDGATPRGAALRFAPAEAAADAYFLQRLWEWRQDFAGRLGAGETGSVFVTVPAANERFRAHFERRLAAWLDIRGRLRALGSYAGYALFEVQPLRHLRAGLFDRISETLPFFELREGRDRAVDLEYLPDRDPAYPRLSDETPPVLAWDWSGRDAALADGRRLRADRVRLRIRVDDPAVREVEAPGPPGTAWPVLREGEDRWIAEGSVPLAEGPNELRATAVDPAGNRSAPLSLLVVRDTAGPRVELTAPSATENPYFVRASPRQASAVEVAGRVIDDDVVRLLIDGETWPLDGARGFRRAYQLAANVAQVVTFETEDDLGNVRRAQLTLVSDALPPYASIVRPKRGAVVAGPEVEVEIAVADANLDSLLVNGRRVELARDANLARVRVPFADGPASVAVLAMDRVGWQSPLRVVEFTVDSVPPHVLVWEPRDHQPGVIHQVRGGRQAHLNLWVHDRSPAELRLEFDGAQLAQVPVANGSGNFTWALELPQAGVVYPVRVIATDAAGNAQQVELLFRR